MAPTHLVCISALFPVGSGSLAVKTLGYGAEDWEFKASTLLSCHC